MKTLISRVVPLCLLGSAIAGAQSGGTFTNYIRQVQLEAGQESVVWDVYVDSSSPEGGSESALAINPGGARFELWTVLNTSPPTSFLLDTRYVGTYVPIADVKIRTEDPFSEPPRTRADRPFYVDVMVDGLLNGVDDPEASKQVKFLRHVQSYGEGGTGENLDRTQATLKSQVYLDQNGTQTLTYEVSSVPGGNLAKLRGEERFSIFSLEDYQAPESQLASMYVQIWPVADATISGIDNGDFLRFTVPSVTLTLNDLYPDSRTYAQVYKGEPQLGTEGIVVPGSALNHYDSAPTSDIRVLENWDTVMEEDGVWTLEVLTETPFGTDRLAYVTFEVDRTIEVNGSVTTID